MEKVNDLSQVLSFELNMKIQFFTSGKQTAENIKKDMMLFDIYLCDLYFHNEIDGSDFNKIHGKLFKFIEEQGWNCGRETCGSNGAEVF